MSDRDLSFLNKDHSIFKNEILSTLWYNHYDRFAQRFLLIGIVSQVSDLAQWPLVCLWFLGVIASWCSVCMLSGPRVIEGSTLT